VWFESPGTKFYLFCATLLYCFFSIFFWKFVNFFWYSNDPKKSANLFYLKIKSSEKQKCVYKLFLSKSKILLRLNQRITEYSQLVIRKFAVFSSGLIIKEMLFKFSSSFLLSIFWSIKYTLFSWNLKNHWKKKFSYYNFANFLGFCDSIFFNF